MTKKSAAPDPVESQLASSLEVIRKKLGDDAAVVPGRDAARSQVRGVVRSGVDVVDRYVLGCGGLPLGRLVEIYSEPGIAKTAFAWTCLGGVQRAGGLAYYCDSEQSYDDERARVFGVDPERLLLQQPLRLEDALAGMETFLLNLEFLGPVMMVWDSLAEAPFKGDLTGDWNKESADDRAKKVGRWCRVMSALAVQKQVCILVVNQARQRRGLIFGDKTTTPGGDALKFFASLRVQLFGGKAVKNAHGQHLGKSVTFMAMKSRFSQPFRKAKVRLDYERGWDNLWSTINHAKDMDLVPKGAKYNAATYSVAIEKLGWSDAAEPVELESTIGSEDETTDTEDDIG